MPYKDPEDQRKADLRYYRRNQAKRQLANRKWKKENHEHYLSDNRRYDATRREQSKERMRGVRCRARKSEQ